MNLRSTIASQMSGRSTRRTWTLASAWLSVNPNGPRPTWRAHGQETPRRPTRRVPMSSRSRCRRRRSWSEGSRSPRSVLQVRLPAVAFTIQAIVAGTMFLRIPNTTATLFSRGGVLYLFVVPSLVSTSSLLTLHPYPASFCLPY